MVLKLNPFCQNCSLHLSPVDEFIFPKCNIQYLVTFTKMKCAVFLFSKNSTHTLALATLIIFLLKSIMLSCRNQSIDSQCKANDNSLLLTNCLKVFDHFMGYALKGLTYNSIISLKWAKVQRNGVLSNQYITRLLLF